MAAPDPTFDEAAPRAPSGLGASVAALRAPDLDAVVEYYASIGKRVIIMDTEQDDDEDTDTASVTEDEGPLTSEASGIFLEPDPLEQIVVKGAVEKTIYLDVDHSTRVHEVKELLFEKSGIAPDEQVLYFGGHRMKAGHTLWYYEMKRGSTIWMSIRLGGSGPKAGGPPGAGGVRKTIGKHKEPKRGNDVVEGDRKLSLPEKLQVLKNRASQMVKRVDEDGEPLPKADDVMLNVAKDIIARSSGNWIKQQIQTMSQSELEELRKDMEENTGRGKKPIQWLCSPELVAFFVREFAAKYKQLLEMEEGRDVVMSAWRLCVSKSFLCEDGTVQIDDMRKAITERSATIKAALGAPKMTAERRGQIQAVIAMNGHVPEEQVAHMMNRLGITKAEWDAVEKGMDVDDCA
jgi:hypothetical protein